MAQTKVLAAILLTITIVKASNGNGSASVNFSNEKDLAEYLNTTESRILEKEFKKAAQCISNRITNGIPSLKVPPLDPMKIPDSQILLLNKLVQSRMLLENIRLDGLGQFKLAKGTVNIILFQVRFKVVFKKIDFSTKYNGNMKLFKMLKLSGKGDVNVTLKNLEVDVIVKYKLKGLTSIKLTKLKVKIILPSIEVKVTGILPNERWNELISEQLTDVLTDLAVKLNRPLSDSIQKIVWKILDEQLNPILVKTSISTLLKMLDDGVDVLCGPYLDQFLQHFKAEIKDTLNNVELDEDYLNSIAENYDVLEIN